jgi:hypothetical protein
MKGVTKPFCLVDAALQTQPRFSFGQRETGCASLTSLPGEIAKNLQLEFTNDDEDNQRRLS